MKLETKLKRRMEELKMSRVQVAELCGVCERAVSYFLNGASNYKRRGRAVRAIIEGMELDKVKPTKNGNGKSVSTQLPPSISTPRPVNYSGEPFTKYCGPDRRCGDRRASKKEPRLSIIVLDRGSGRLVERILA